MVVSEYEKERQERIDRNREQLAKLNIPSLSTRTKAETPKPKPREKRKEQPEEQAPRRRSLRARGLDPEGQEAAEAAKAIEVAAAVQRRTKHTGTEKVADLLWNAAQYEDLEGDSADRQREQFSASFFGSLSQDCKPLKLDGPSGVDAVASLQLTAERKLTKVRVYSLCVDPREDRTLIYAGDRDGFFTAWHYEQEDAARAILQLEPFAGAISAVRCRPATPERVLAASLDGTIRSLDLTEQRFTTIFEERDEDPITDIQHLKPDVLWYCTSGGVVGVLDARVGSSPSLEEQLHDKKVSSLSLHEASGTLVTGSNDTTAKVFDLRKVKPSAEIKTFSHGRAVSSALLSPDGTNLVTTSYDNVLRVFSSPKGTWDDAARAFKHDNNTGRWISNFKADWHPFEPGIFICGSKTNPHGIDIFDTSRSTHSVARRLVADQLTSIPARHAFHPTFGTLACGTASGKVYIYTPPASN